jgi:hypothetical protein
MLAARAQAGLAHALAHQVFVADRQTLGGERPGIALALLLLDLSQNGTEDLVIRYRRLADPCIFFELPCRQRDAIVLMITSSSLVSRTSTCLPAALREKLLGSSRYIAKTAAGALRDATSVMPRRH